MDTAEHSKALAASWRQIRSSLGHPLGDHLDDTREWIGDRAFLELSQQFSAGEVIICCGIQIAAELVGVKLKEQGRNPRDIQLTTAVKAAHDALRQ